MLKIVQNYSVNAERNMIIMISDRMKKMMQMAANYGAKHPDYNSKDDPATDGMKLAFHAGDIFTKR